MVLTASSICLRPFNCGKIAMLREINFIKGHFNLPWEVLKELQFLVFINTLTLTHHNNTWESPRSNTVIRLIEQERKLQIVFCILTPATYCCGSRILDVY